MFAVSLILLIGSIVSAAQGDFFLWDFHLYPGRTLHFIGVCGLLILALNKIIPLCSHLCQKSQRDPVSKYTDHLYL